MDRSSMIGLTLIAVILIGYSVLTAPSEAELAAQKRTQDSIALVEKAQKQAAAIKPVAPVVASTIIDTTLIADSSKIDSIKAVNNANLYGAFANAASGKEETFTIENELVKVTLSTLGGRVNAVELKKYKNSVGKPVVLFNGDSTKFGLNFFAQNRSISTNNLFFNAVGKSFVVARKDSNSIALRLNAGSPDRYIEFLYSLKGDAYTVGYKVNFVGVDQIIAPNTGYVELNWMQNLQNQENDLTTERANSTVYYMFSDEEVDFLSETKDDEKQLPTKVKWVAMKQHFFTQVLIADKDFDKPTNISCKLDESKNAVKDMKASFTIPYSHAPNESFGMSFYFGPNHYQILKKTGFNLEKQIPLGWGIFGWVNRFIVIPIFNFLNSFDWSYGIIILILTIAIKLMLSPFTFKAYLSQAKMKVLKPEVDEIQAKHKEDPMKLQQEMMGLYKKAGVSPLGGCFPMLLQMPILIAMFRFFPQSIELRQESFLWAKDLSTYDSILDLPFSIPFYGDHVSLWTLLMTVSTLLITKVNSGSQMANPQMKWMLYLMPIIFLGVFNNYSAGLSYYYFLANMISIGQQYLFKYFVDHDEIHRKIQENKKRPQANTKSKFQQRLEKMAKERGVQLPKK